MKKLPIIKKKTHPTTQYAKDIVAKRIPANKWVTLACKRHLNDLKTAKQRGIYFDEAAANHIIAFFPEFLSFYEGDFSDKPFNLTPHQKFLVGSIFGWKRSSDGFRRFRTAYVEEAKGNGKALWVETPIPTPTGWERMGDLGIGDEVFDENGVVCKVIAATDEMFDHDCFKVMFSDGSEIIADADHLWRTHTQINGKKARSITAKGKTLTMMQWSKETGLGIGTIWSRIHNLGWTDEEAVTLTVEEGIVKRREWRHNYKRGDQKKGLLRREKNDDLWTTREIANTVRVNRENRTNPQAKWNHRIDMSGPLELPHVELPIPPYTLGAWLGDGDSDSARLTMAIKDSQIAEEIRDEGVAAEARKEHTPGIARMILGSSGRSQKSRNNSLQAVLRTHNLLKNKHIPPVYYRASYDQRMALLQGLMDTDGYVPKNGQCEIALCNGKLARDVYDLIITLGYKCTILESDAVLEGRVVGKRWRMQFKANREKPPVRLARKLKNLPKRPKTRPISDGRMIVGCDPVPSVPVKCITVDSNSQMYLAGEDMIPTHNSPLAGGIGLYGLTFDDEPGAEVYAAAVTREQAGILFRDARTFAEKSDSLREILKVDKTNIAYDAENSYFRAISSEHRGLDGKRPHIALIDEIHEHPNDLVVRKMSAGTKGRRQSIIFEITNSGYDRHSICYQHHDYTSKVLEGTIKDDAWFGMMTGIDVCEKCESEGYTVPQDGCPDCDDWRDPEVWEKANPNMHYLGQPFIDYLHRQVDEAKAMPKQENIVKRLNFCIWTESIMRWIPADKWVSCEDETLRIEDFAGKTCYVAVDLASKIDIASVVILFLTDETFTSEDGVKSHFAIFSKHYLPEDTIRESKNHKLYEQWVKDGWITPTPGARTDFKYIEDDLKALNEENHIVQLAFDPKEATYLISNIMEWTDEDTCVEINQGPALISEPMKELEARVYSNQIWHDGNPVLSWMISNVVLKTARSSGPIKYYYPTKDNADNKIDGAVALIMVVGRAMLQQGPEASVYDGLTVEEMKQRMAY